jgi:hypothetical protein
MSEFNNDEIKDILHRCSGKENVIVPEVISIGNPNQRRSSLDSSSFIQYDPTIYDPAEIEKINQSLEAMFTEYNKRYNLSFTIDYSSLSKSLMSLADPQNKRIAELYVSETFSRLRVIMYTQLTRACLLLAQQIFDPEKLLSATTTYADKFIIIDKLLDYMSKLNNIYKEVSISTSELELKKIGDTSRELDQTDETVTRFLEELSNAVRNKELNFGSE